MQQLSIFSQLQLTGSFRHSGQIIAPHPKHVLSSLLQAVTTSISVQFYFYYPNVLYKILEPIGS